MDWWGIGLIVAAGVAVVVYGYVDDRRKTRERDAAMLAPPKRDIPRFQPMAEAPAYLSELQARTRPDQLASTDLNALTRTDLLAAQAAAPSVTVGIAAKDFITDSPTGWAVAANPMVVVLSDEVSTVREAGERAWLRVPIDASEWAYALRARQTKWRQGEHAAAIAAVLKEREGPRLWADLARGCVYAPYPGGADLICTDAAQRALGQAHFADWLSPQASGL